MIPLTNIAPFFLFRGEHSLLSRLQCDFPNVSLDDYVSFFALRNYGYLYPPGSAEVGQGRECLRFFDRPNHESVPFVKLCGVGREFHPVAMTSVFCLVSDLISESQYGGEEQIPVLYVVDSDGVLRLFQGFFFFKIFITLIFILKNCFYVFY